MTAVIAEVNLSRPLGIATITASGITEHLVANAAQRRAIAEAYDLLAVNALSAEIVVARLADDVIAIDGRLLAEVVQTCVVTLEPVTQAINEPVSARYAVTAAAGKPVTRATAAANPEVEPPEPIRGTTIDLGAVVLEHLAVAIDPYPRAPGAELPASTEAAASASPFAVLAQLRDGKN
jgi:hypothetical protein